MTRGHRLDTEPGAPATVGAQNSAMAGAVRGHGQLLALGVLVLVAVLLISAAAPSRAQALQIGPLDINPLGLPGDPLGGLLGGAMSKLAVGGFDAVIKALFAPVAKFITTQLIGWLVTVPNLTQGNVARLEQTVEAMGGGLLGAVATFSTIRYWAAGFAGGSDSGFAALEGLTRTITAALLLAVWPWLFATAVQLTNLFTGSLLGSGAVVHSVSHLLAAGLGAGIGLSFTPIGLFLNIAIAVAASLLFLGLLLMKIVVSCSTILVFVAMPLAVVIWPVLPWIARLAMRAFAVCLIVPVMWSLCFAASAAVSLNAISFNADTFMNTLLQPLVAIVLLWLTIRLATHLARVAMLGAAPLGGGFVSRAVSYAAGSQLHDSARAHLPNWASGHSAQQSETPSSQAESRTASRLRTAATLAGAAATGGATATAAGGASAATAGASGTGGIAATSTTAGGQVAGGGGGGRAYTPPPTAQANSAGQPLQSGLQTPSFAGRDQDFQNETFEAQYRARTSPPSAQQASAALQSLPAGTQRAVGQLVADHGGGAREHLAYQALGEWSPAQREALRTLAAASPAVRAQAIGEAAGASDQHDGVTSPGGVQSQPALDEGTRGALPDPVSTPAVEAGSPAPAPAPARDRAAVVDGKPTVPPAGSPLPSPAPISQPEGRPSSAREPRGPSPDDVFPSG